MKVKTTFSTILTLVMLFAFGFNAHAEDDIYKSWHNSPLNKNNSEMQTFLAQKFGMQVQYDDGEVITTKKKMKVANGTGHFRLIPTHFEWVSNPTTADGNSYNVTWYEVEAGKGDYYYDSEDSKYCYTDDDQPETGCNIIVESATPIDYSSTSAGYKLVLATFESAVDLSGNPTGDWEEMDVPLYNYSSFSTSYEPTVPANQVVIIEVNPLWRGAREVYGSDKGTDPCRWSDEWDQCYYGVKNVITEGIRETTTPTGKLYGYYGPLTRFFFAKRRPASEETQGFKKDYDGVQYTPYRPMLMRWYNEWSTVENTNKGWDSFASSEHYTEVNKGTAYHSPHNCSSSLETNHYISLVDVAHQDETRNVSVLFYIDNTTTTSPGGTNRDITDTSKQPFMFTLKAEQEIPDVRSSSVVSGKDHDIWVIFNTNFDDQGKSFCSSDGKNGALEYFYIYRKGPNDSDFVPVEGAQGITLQNCTLLSKSGQNYTYKDQGFSETGSAYDVEYKIYVKVFVVSGGKIVGTVDDYMVMAETNPQTATIPGNDAFKLQLTGEQGAVYTPVAGRDGYQQGKNKFTNNLSATFINNKYTSITVGDKFELKRNPNATGGEVIKTLIVTDYYTDTYTEGYFSWKITYLRTNVKYKIDGGAEQTYYESVEKKNNSTPYPDITAGFIVKVTQAFTSVQDVLVVGGAETADATYKLFMTPASGNVLQSNLVTMKTYQTIAVRVDTNHRQGHPNTGDGRITETIHNEVKFKPVSGITFGYYILRNGCAFTKCVRFVTPDEVAGYGPNDYFKYEDVFDPNDPAELVNDGEGTTYGANKTYYYTVVGQIGGSMYSGGKTYGSNDVQYTYNGNPEELVFYTTPTPDPEAPQTSPVTAHVERNNHTLKMYFTLQLTPGNGANASDVIQSKFAGTSSLGSEDAVDIFGEFATVQTTRLNSEDDNNIESVGVQYPKNYPGTSSLVSVPKYVDLDVQYTDWYEAIQAGTKTWKEVSKDIWNLEMPQRVYAAIKYKDQKPSGDIFTYDKYTNWVAVTGTWDGDPQWTGIDDVNTDDTRVSVYPNPATDYITVEGANGSVALFSATGAQVAGVNGQGTVTIDVSGLSKGVYVLKTGNVTEKILIK